MEQQKKKQLTTTPSQVNLLGMQRRKSEWHWKKNLPHIDLPSALPVEQKSNSKSVKATPMLTMKLITSNRLKRHHFIHSLTISLSENGESDD